MQSLKKILQSVLNLETTRGQTDIQTDGRTDGHKMQNFFGGHHIIPITSPLRVEGYKAKRRCSMASCDEDSESFIEFYSVVL